MKINNKLITASAIAFIVFCWVAISCWYAVAASAESSAKCWQKYTSFAYECLRRGRYADAKLGFLAALTEAERRDSVGLLPDITRVNETYTLCESAMKKMIEPLQFYTRIIITNFNTIFVFLVAGIFEVVILDWHVQRTKKAPSGMWNLLWNILWIAVWFLLTAFSCNMKEGIEECFRPAITHIEFIGPIDLSHLHYKTVQLDIVSDFYRDPYFQDSALSDLPGWGVGRLSILCCATISGAIRAVLGCLFSDAKNSIGFYMLALFAAEVLGAALLLYWEIDVFRYSSTRSEISGLCLPSHGDTNLAVRLMFLGYLKECFNNVDLFLFQLPAIILFFVWLQHRHEITKRSA